MSIRRKWLLLTAPLLFFISACEPTKVVLTAENIDQDKLIRKIKQQQINHKEEYDSLQIAFNTDHEITVSGNSDQIQKIIKIADELDRVVDYYLEISNTDQEHVNSREESLSVLLYPGETVILGESIWQSSPWRHYRGIESSKLLKLTLDHSLKLTINMSRNDGNHEKFTSGTYQLKEDRWIQIAGDIKKKGAKEISTRPSKALWLRLTEANSQEQFN